MKKEIMISGNRAVVIIMQDTFYAFVCVNVKNGMDAATVTNLTWKGKTLSGARRWAKKQLEN